MFAARDPTFFWSTVLVIGAIGFAGVAAVVLDDDAIEGRGPEAHLARSLRRPIPPKDNPRGRGWSVVAVPCGSRY